MGIKGGSGRGSVDKQGDRENVPGGVGSSRKRNRVPFPPPPPKKPYDRIKDPFEDKPDFRLGYYLVEEEFDDYLVCHGFDPNSPKPASEITPDAYKTIKVAKPWELQRTPWDGETVTIDNVDYTYTYTGIGLRTATDEDGNEEDQRIDLPYKAPGQQVFIVAVQLKKNAWVEGTEVEDTEGTRLRWIDLNVAGRHWKATATSTSPLIGTLDDDLSESSSATITVTAGGSGTKTVYERLGLGSNDPLPSGTKVAVVYVNELGYVVFGAGCPT